MWSFLVFGRLSLCFSGWVGLVSGVDFFVGTVGSVLVLGRGGDK